MNKEELHRALTAYLPEEVEWKKKYLKSLADGELPACMVNDPMKILSDDSDERDTSLDYGTHYFEGLRNIALHRLGDILRYHITLISMLRLCICMTEAERITLKA